MEGHRCSHRLCIICLSHGNHQHCCRQISSHIISTFLERYQQGGEVSLRSLSREPRPVCLSRMENQWTGLSKGRSWGRCHHCHPPQLGRRYDPRGGGEVDCPSQSGGGSRRGGGGARGRPPVPRDGYPPPAWCCQGQAYSTAHTNRK